MDLTCKPSTAVSIMRRAIEADAPLFSWGPPGIGKSDLAQQVTNQYDNSLLIDLRLALLEPTDLRGYPFRNPSTNTMEWSPPTDLPSLEEAKNYNLVVLFLDELNSAPPSVQAAAYQLILNRRIGKYKLPDNVRILAAGNRDTDRGVTYRMPAPLANRFRHISMVADHEDWITWAINNNVHPDVVGYLSYAKSNLFKFDPKSNSPAFPTPRSWVSTSRALAIPEFSQIDDAEQHIEVAGIIGEGVAGEFIEHRRVADKMPLPEDVASRRVKELDRSMENEIGAKYSLVVNVAYHLNSLYKENGMTKEFKTAFNNCMRFSFENFQPEMVVLFMKTIMRDYGIKFNIHSDLEKDLFKIFTDRYTKFIV